MYPVNGLPLASVVQSTHVFCHKNQGREFSVTDNLGPALNTLHVVFLNPVGMPKRFCNKLSTLVHCCNKASNSEWRIPYWTLIVPELITYLPSETGFNTRLFSMTIIHIHVPTVSPLFVTTMVTYPYKLCIMGCHDKHLNGFNNWSVTYFECSESTYFQSIISYTT
jgi:hypothetical protein